MFLFYPLGPNLHIRRHVVTSRFVSFSKTVRMDSKSLPRAVAIFPCCQCLPNATYCKIVNIWMWVINPLVPGWGTGPETTRSLECLVLPYIWTWFSSGFWYRADFWSPRSGRWKELVTLLDFRPENRIRVLTMTTDHMHQNRTISFFRFQRGEAITTYIFVWEVNDPLPYCSSFLLLLYQTNTLKEVFHLLQEQKLALVLLCPRTSALPVTN